MTAAIIDQCLTQVAATIAGLTLTGIDPANVVSMLSGEDQGGNGPLVNGYPCVICFYASAEQENKAFPSTATDDFVYPVSVAMIATENADQVTDRQRNWLWRQTIRGAFHNKRLLGVLPAGMAYRCEVDLQTPVSRPRWLQQQHFQGLIVNVSVREYRP